MTYLILFVLGLVLGFVLGFFLEAVRTHNQQAHLIRDDLGAIAADVRQLHVRLAEQQTQQLARDAIALVKARDQAPPGPTILSPAPGTTNVAPTPPTPTLNAANN